MSTCVIHIGTEKTGSTFLQNWLYKNGKRLSRQGVALTRTASFPNNRKIVSYLQEDLDEYFREHGVASHAARELHFSGFEQDFRAELIDCLRKHHTVLLTSEHFHSRFKTEASVKRLRDFLEPHFSEFRIVCYFREQSKVRTSLYSTALRGQYKNALHDFHPDPDINSHYYNYSEVLQKWERVFGAENLVARIYDHAQFYEGDLRKDFLKFALPRVKRRKLGYRNQTDNRALSRSMATLFLAINKKRSRFAGRFVDPTPRAFKAALSRLSFIDDGVPLLDERQNQLYDKFNRQNIGFFKRFFSSSENLFSRPQNQHQAAPEPVFSLLELETILAELLAIPGLLVLESQDVSMLEALSDTLIAREEVSKTQITGLLKIAQRARPENRVIEQRLRSLLTR